MRKHRLAERLLLDVIGLEWEYVHDEACRWEHVMSERVERKLLSMLADPRESPYGNPIPGLEELGGPAVGDGFRAGVVALPDVLPRTGATDVVVRRLGEPLQTDLELMGELSRVGVLPGRQVRAERTGTKGATGIRLETSAGSVEVPVPAASHLFVVVVGVS
jgi:DtxR family Mn-dependent transcriptional regulator